MELNENENEGERRSSSVLRELKFIKNLSFKWCLYFIICLSEKDINT